MCGITAKPPHREIQKTALGATDSVNWRYFKSTKEAINALKNDGFTLISVEQASTKTMLHDFSVNSKLKYALIFGHEVNGVDQEIVDMSDLVIEIPQFGTKHSFNLSVSVGVVLWEFCKAYL